MNNKIKHKDNHKVKEIMYFNYLMMNLIVKMILI